MHACQIHFVSIREQTSVKQMCNRLCTVGVPSLNPGLWTFPNATPLSPTSLPVVTLSYLNKGKNAKNKS